MLEGREMSNSSAPTSAPKRIPKFQGYGGLLLGCAQLILAEPHPQTCWKPGHRALVPNWGTGRGEKPSRAPQGCGRRGRVPLACLERSSITRWCCNPALQHPALYSCSSHWSRAANPRFFSSAPHQETPNPWLGPDKRAPSVASPAPRNIFPIQTKSFSGIAASPATSVLDHVLDY